MLGTKFTRYLRLTGITTGICLSIATQGFAVPVYPNGFPTDPSFFPLGVWLQSPGNAPEFKALGINTYIGLWKGPTEDQLAALAKNNMLVVAGQNDAALTSGNGHVLKGWLHHDEPDNAQPDGKGGYGPCIPAADVAEQSRQFKLRDPSRPVFIDFGQGVAYAGWLGRGNCTGDMAYYDTAKKNADILSFDIYPVASNQAVVQGKLEYVAFGVDNLVKRASPDQSVWADIETTQINSHNLVTPDQLRSEVWMALIHGATGIDYFVHEWTGGFREDGIFRHPEIVDAVTRINQTIKALAPVLKSPNAPIRLSVTSPAISTMIKMRGNILYIFAVSLQGTGVQASFTLPDVKAPVASVAGENRSIALVNGKFLDTFSGYGVHRYEISLAADK
ncbi:MAG TPA: hypothetical protein VNW15_04410 [Rhizomicrobium sp.]|jgi:hypothetical protein|nr:hypothetical protein [Rhizomicrobium sp.]